MHQICYFFEKDEFFSHAFFTGWHPLQEAHLHAPHAPQFPPQELFPAFLSFIIDLTASNTISITTAIATIEPQFS